MSKRKGFTLVELLVVIAIIALLLSILMPSLGKVRTQARTVICKANLKQWGLAFSAYTNSNNGHFWRGASGWGYEWVWANLSFFKNKGSINFCPAATALHTAGDKSNKRLYSAWTMAPIDFRGYVNTTVHGSYGLNGWVDTPPTGADICRPGEGIYNGTPNFFWGTTEVKSASNVPVLLDTAWVWNSLPTHYSLPPEYEGQNRLDASMAVQMYDFAFSRHGGGLTNSLFMDMSARTGGLKKLWKLKWHREFDTETIVSFTRAAWMNKSATMNRDF